MNLRFDGQVVCITGASGGIGAAAARAFANAGAELVVHYASRREVAEALVAEIVAAGVTAYAVGADLAEPDGARELIEAIRSRSGRLDVLVNNAGGQVRRSPVAETDDELYAALRSINLDSAFRTCRAAIPLLAASGGGAIVNVSSVSARNGGGGGSVVYSAMKAALSTLTRGLAKELVPLDIRVNTVAPGLIDTPFHDATPPSTWESVVAGIPAGRAGRPEEVAGPILFLAHREAASYVNGHSLEVNGAQYMP